MDRENSVYLEHAYGVSIWFDRSRSSDPFTLDIPHRRGITLRDTNFATLGKARGAAAKLFDEPEAAPIGLYCAYRPKTHEGPWLLGLVLRTGRGFLIRPVNTSSDGTITVIACGSADVYVERNHVAAADDQQEVDRLNRLAAERDRIVSECNSAEVRLPLNREKLIKLARAQRRRPAKPASRVWGPGEIAKGIEDVKAMRTIVITEHAGAPFDVVVCWADWCAVRSANTRNKLVEALGVWFRNNTCAREVQS